MRPMILAVGILLMGIPAYFGLWPLALVAAVLTALAFVHPFEFYRSIPFLLALLGCLSFIPRSRSHRHRLNRHILGSELSLTANLRSRQR